MSAIVAALRISEGITAMPALEIAARVQRGDLTPREVVAAHLERIADVDPRVGALSAVREREALDEADALQQRDDIAQLPLAGVPVAVKESFAVKGLPTLHGSAATSRAPAGRDDLVVRRLREAGAIVIAKTHMPELAIWPVTESAICNTRNPWDTSRTPGGSSGGSGVAVATGMAALALGSDGGGSLRIPAACCGIVAVKTTPRLVPLAGDASTHWHGLSVVGPMARTVDDAALMLDVLTARRGFRNPQPPREPLRISMSTRHPVLGARIEADVAAATKAVGDALARQGHTVREAHPNYPAHPVSFLRCWLSGIADEADELQLDLAAVEPRTRALAKRGRLVRRLHRGRHAQTLPDARALRAWIRRRDVLIAPVLAGAPPEIGRWWNMGWLRTALVAAGWMGFNPPWNLAGCPSVAVPVRRGREGHVIAVQLVGKPGAERHLLGLAKQIEAVLPFNET